MMSLIVYLFNDCAVLSFFVSHFSDFVTVRQWGVIEGVYYDANVYSTWFLRSFY